MSGKLRADGFRLQLASASLSGKSDSRAGGSSFSARIHARAGVGLEQREHLLAVTDTLLST